MDSRESWKLFEESKQLKQPKANSKSERIKEKIRSKYSNKDKKVLCYTGNDRGKWTENLIAEAETAAKRGTKKHKITR